MILGESEVGQILLDARLTKQSRDIYYAKYYGKGGGGNGQLGKK